MDICLNDHPQFIIARSNFTSGLPSHQEIPRREGDSGSFGVDIYPYVADALPMALLWIVDLIMYELRSRNVDLDVVPTGDGWTCRKTLCCAPVRCLTTYIGPTKVGDK